MLNHRIMSVLTASLTASALAGQGTEYRVVIIPQPPGGEYSSVTGLNNSNEVTGNVLIDTQSRPYLFSDGASTILDEVPGVNTPAMAINDSAHVTGWMYTWGEIWPEAFLWDGAANHRLGRPDGAYTYGQGTNGFDQVVGFYFPPGGHANGNVFVYTGGAFHDLGGGQAQDINDAGVIVGQINRYFGETAVWEPDGNGGWDRTVLDGLLARAVNESGTMIAGSGPLLFYFDRAAVWTRAGGAWVRTDIGDWDPATTASIAYDVNDHGQVVGSFQGFDVPDRGWIWEAGGVAWLDDRLAPGHESWSITAAYGVNESGSILATAEIAGVDENVILIPDELTILGPRPGVAGETNQLIATSATPGDRVYFIYGLAEGSTSIPGCPGVDVGIAAPKVAGSAIANADLEARISAFVPQAAAGRTIYLQAVEPANCGVSNVMSYQLR